MAATDAGLDHIADQTHRMATDMSKTEKSAEGLSSHFRQLALAFVGAEALKNVVVEMVKRTTVYQSINQAISKENLDRSMLLKREIDLTSERNVLGRSISTATGLEGDYQRARLAVVERQLLVLEKQKIVSVAMENIGQKTLGVATLYVAALTDLYAKTSQFNQNLIEANASWSHRNSLLQETLITQAQLGMSFGDITKAAAALVHYSLDTESSFNDNLRLVVQMEHGLGVSVNASAQLASIVERQLKGSFTDVAHVIAQIVDDTSLAGDEAVRLATAISTAMGRLRPGLSAAGLPEVLRLVGRYESALKEVGGAPGAFQQLITSLTTPGGIVGAGALGVNPEFIATSEGVQQVMDRFAKYGDMLVGQSQGWERQFRLQMLADVFGTSADSANQMLIAIQRANQQQMGAISIQERWREQMHATNNGVSRLANSLVGLLQGGLLPVVQFIGYITNKLADFVEAALKYRPVVIGAMIALGAGLLVVGYRLWALVRALIAVTVTATTAASAIARQAAANAAQQLMLPGFGGAAGRAAGLGSLRLLGVFAGTLFAGALAQITYPLIFMGIMLGLIYRVNKQSRDDALASQKIQIAMSDRLESSARARIYAAARSGKAEEEVLKIYKSLAGQAQFHGTTLAEQKAWLDAQTAKVDLDVLKATATAGMFTPLVERTPEQTKHEGEMRGISEKLLKVNEDQKVLLDKQQKQQLENARDAQVEEAKNRVWYLRGSWNPLRTASDYYSEVGSGSK